jgi:predicted DNA binding CopG/RHH family protein
MEQVVDSEEKKRRLNAEIEDSLYRRIKMKAAEEGRTISEMTREMWIEYLSK